MQHLFVGTFLLVFPYWGFVETQSDDAGQNHLTAEQVNGILQRRRQWVTNYVEFALSSQDQDKDAYFEWLELSRRFDSGDKTIFHMFREAASGLKAAEKTFLRSELIKLFRLLQPAKNVESMLVTSIVKLLGTSVTQEEEDSFLCSFCEILVLALKTAGSTGIIEWSDLYPPLYYICITVGPWIIQDLRADVLCKGVLELQGPHVFDAVSTIIPLVEPRTHCEFINICFPPNDVDETSTPTLENSIEQRNEMYAPGMLDRSERHSPDLQNAIKVVHLTDIHIEQNYKENSDTDCKLPVCCLEKWGTGSARPHGEYECNTPERTIDLFVNRVARLNPDFIIYSGDNPPHTMWEETEWSQWNCSLAVIKAFKRGLAGRRIYPNIGNHEMFPANIYYQNLESTTEGSGHLAEWWSEFARFSADNIRTMSEGSYYSLVVSPGLRILSYNTNFMYSFNWYAPVQDNIEHFPPWQSNTLRNMEMFIENTLKDAKAAGEKVIIIGHHPPGRADFVIQFSRWLSDIHLQYSDVITLHLSGHTHKNEIKLIKDSVGLAKAMIYVAPSVTPLNYINPSLRMFYLDNSTYEVIDYDQYHLDLEKTLALNTPPVIEHQYRASEEYVLPDLSPTSWADLISRMDSDHSLFMKYYRNYHSRAPPGESCDRVTCKPSILCSLVNTNYDQYQRCVRLNTPSTTTTTTTQATSSSIPYTTTATSKTSTPNATFSVTTSAIVNVSTTSSAIITTDQTSKEVRPHATWNSISYCLCVCALMNMVRS